MKKMGFVIVFSIVLVLYSLINFYILYRGLQAFQPDPNIKRWVIIGFIFVVFSFVAGRFLERISVNWLTTSLIWIGSFWLAIMVYLLLQLVIIDLFRLFNNWIGFLPRFFTPDSPRFAQITGAVVISITFIVVALGHLNTWFPKTRMLALNIDKKAGNLNELHIVALSDIHLGTIIEKRHMKGIIRRVNELNPDIILIPGDIIDEDIAPVINSNVGEKLRTFKSKYGVYAVTGNHEYIGGVDKAKTYLSDHNIQLLHDTTVMIDESFYIAGREDLTISQFTDQKRKPLEDILAEVDQSYPIILLDHQPFKLEQAVDNKVDLQLSGHTHHGQLWPFNYITNLVYELSWGYKKKENTHFYVSSGVGGWGPPIRTVNRPEIISILLKFK